MPTQYDVFLSYNRDDTQAVQSLYDRLSQEAKLKPFLDSWNLVPGDPRQEGLEEALAASATVAVFVGPTGVRQWNNAQMRVALEQAMRSQAEYRVIPVLLPGASEAALDGFLGLRVWVDFRLDLDDAAAFQRLVAGIKGEAITGGSYTLPDDPAPYRSLERFEAEHTRFFFGREAERRQLLERLKQQPLVAVVGASGSGKSSLVRAGLFPDLVANALPDSSQWPRLIFCPGSQPLRALAEQVALLAPSQTNRLQEVDSLTQRLAGQADGLRTAISAYLADQPYPVLLVIDQFEEVFTQCREDPSGCRSQAEQFFANLADAVEQSNGCIRVLLTLRADFLDPCLAFPALCRLLQDRQFLLGPLDQAAMREAIVRPAQAVGAFLEKGLVNLILGEVDNEPGSLPLLQHALYELWRARRGPWLTIEAYEASGGVKGALQRRAQATLDHLTPEQQKLAQNIFIRLTTLGEGVSDTRRRITRAELYPAGVVQAQVDEVLEALKDKDSRLIIEDADKTVQVTHEALIQHWPTLRGWLDQNRQALRIQRRLTEAAATWDENQQDVSYLYEGARLASTREWAEQHPGEMTGLEQTFLRRSHVVETTSARNRMIGVTIAFIAVLIFAIMAAWFGVQADHDRVTAVTAEAKANQQAEIAFSRQLAAQSTSARLNNRLDLALLLGMAASTITDTIEARGSLLDGLMDNPPLAHYLTNHNRDVSSPAFSPDGQTLASGSGDSIILWDVSRPSGPVPISSPLTSSGVVRSLAFSPDGQTLASGSGDSIILWDVGQPGVSVPLSKTLTSPGGDPQRVAFSPDGKTLASVSFDGTMILRDVSQPSISVPVRQFPITDVISFAFSPDMKTLASTNGGSIILWDVSQPTSPIRIGQPLTSSGPVGSLAFSPDGKTLGSRSGDSIILWDVSQPNISVSVRQTLPSPAGVLAFSSDGKTLASTNGGSIILWDVSQPNISVSVRQTLSSPADVWSLAFSPDGKTLASDSGDSIILWDVGQPNISDSVSQTLSGTGGKFAFNPNGKTLASGSGDSIILCDMSQPNISISACQTLPIPADVLAFSSDGKTLASGSFTGSFTDNFFQWDLILWDVSQPSGPVPISSRLTSSGLLRGLDFSQDGKTLASGSSTDNFFQWDLILWDVSQPNISIPVRQSLITNVTSFAFSPDGKTLASGDLEKETIILWDVSQSDTPVRLGIPLTTGHNPVMSLAFSPDGKTLASGGGWDKSILLWDVSQLDTPVRLGIPLTGHNDFVKSVAFSPDGRILASGSGDSIILWDVSQLTNPIRIGQPLTGHTEAIDLLLAFSPDGRILASGSGDSIILWDVSLKSWQTRACQIANRNLTQAEWQQYVGEAKAYCRVCPDLPPDEVPVCSEPGATTNTPK